ncbi:ScpA family protein [Actinomycetaceae bacterium MB13-C1-2]|nr:ScpA family protein [Actinomycetaceae bacterium MB13-C1-2]
MASVEPQENSADTAVTPTEETFGPQTLRGFEVDLDNFQGPFDLLLRLIARHDLDLTEVALAAVTDEFLQYLRGSPDLSSATDFLVVAATLLDMKAAALLPQIPGEEPSAEDLEARDLLFARLLQYRAFKDAAAVLSELWRTSAGGVPRAVPLEQPYASMLPELRWSTTPEQLALIAEAALTSKPRPDLAEHVARISASLDEELKVVRDHLRREGSATFARLIEGATIPAIVVTRFLALLELYRRGRVSFDQPEPMGKLLITWREKRRGTLPQAEADAVLAVRGSDDESA